MRLKLGVSYFVMLLCVTTVLARTRTGDKDRKPDKTGDATGNADVTSLTIRTNSVYDDESGACTGVTHQIKLCVKVDDEECPDDDSVSYLIDWGGDEIRVSLDSFGNTSVDSRPDGGVWTTVSGAGGKQWTREGEECCYTFTVESGDGAGKVGSEGDLDDDPPDKSVNVGVSSIPKPPPAAPPPSDKLPDDGQPNQSHGWHVESPPAE